MREIWFRKELNDLALDVVAIGNIVSDFVAAPVHSLPNWGELYQVDQPISLNIGGNAAIFSVCASKLGLTTGLLGAVGEDEIGELLIAKFKAAEVDTSKIKLTKEKPTAVTLAIANETGERSFFHHFGANSEFELDDVDFEYLADAKAMLLCSYFIMPKLQGEPARAILKRAKENNLTTFFDVAWDPAGKWKLDDILDYVDVFIPNEDEVLRLTNENNISNAIGKLLDVGVETVVVKMGASGCLVKNQEGEEYRINAHSVKALDTTGAGDTFNAGFVYGILSNWDLEKTAQFANAAAALSVTKIGGATAAPTVAEVEEFLTLEF